MVNDAEQLIQPSGQYYGQRLGEQECNQVADQ
jgi:hypothetical protein